MLRKIHFYYCFFSILVLKGCWRLQWSITGLAVETIMTIIIWFFILGLPSSFLWLVVRNLSCWGFNAIRANTLFEKSREWSSLTLWGSMKVNKKTLNDFAVTLSKCHWNQDHQVISGCLPSVLCWMWGVWVGWCHCHFQWCQDSTQKFWLPTKGSRAKFFLPRFVEWSKIRFSQLRCWKTGNRWPMNSHENSWHHRCQVITSWIPTQQSEP